MSLRALPRLLTSILIVTGAVACNPPSLPQKPQLELSRESIEVGLAYVGTSVQESLQIENQGLEDLVINGVDLSGDAAFTKSGLSNPADGGTAALPLTIPGRQSTFVSVFFKPTQAKEYTGQLTIHSNAENAPDKVVQLTGKGQ